MRAKPSEHLSTAIAILIAFITVVGALIAWRVSQASSVASNADTDGILAEVDGDNAYTGAFISGYAHLTAYAHSVVDTTLARELLAAAPKVTDDKLKTEIENERQRVLSESYADLLSVPQKYLDPRDFGYDVAKEIGETRAERAVERDIFSAPHFAAANAARGKAEWLLVILVVLGGAFVILTIADAIKNQFSYLLFFLALAIVMIGSLSALAIDIFGAPQLVIRF